MLLVYEIKKIFNFIKFCYVIFVILNNNTFYLNIIIHLIYLSLLSKTRFLSS